MLVERYEDIESLFLQRAHKEEGVMERWCSTFITVISFFDGYRRWEIASIQNSGVVPCMVCMRIVKLVAFEMLLSSRVNWISWQYLHMCFIRESVSAFEVFFIWHNSALFRSNFIIEIGRPIFVYDDQQDQCERGLEDSFLFLQWIFTRASTLVRVTLTKFPEWLFKQDA